jgi:hypothetical protein
MSRIQTALLSFLFGVAMAAPSAHAQATLHLFGYAGEPVDAVIDWGSEAANAACLRIIQGPGRSVTCEEARAGDRIRISGTVPQFGPGVSSETGNTVSRVVSWGNVGLRSLDAAFKGNDRLASLPTTLPSTVENLNRTFQDAPNFSQNLASWGMALKNVLAMTDLFDGALSQQTDMSRWCMRRFNEEPPGLMGRQAGRHPPLKNSQQKHPRYGECGVSLPANLPETAEQTVPFFFNLRSGLEIWPNAPSGTSLSLITFEVSSGELPPGLVLDPLTGVISGVPTTPGEYAFQIRARQLN